MSEDGDVEGTEEVVAFAPGRVNLIGEHTDYNDGLALPFAISDGVTVRGSHVEGRTIEARALDLGEADRFEIGERPAAAGDWRAFVRGAAIELGEAGLDPDGARIEITGSVPRGAGLSSSAALEVAACLALIALTGAEPPPKRDLARLCSRIENRWVGAQTGLLDQLASLFGEPDAALRIDFRSLQIDPVRLELGDWRLVILDSGERHSIAESGYNQRRSECRRAAELLGIASLRDADSAQLARLPEPLDRRARHVVEENIRVEDAVAALRSGDLDRVAGLLDASHASQRDLYEVSTEAVERAASALREAGAAGVRLIGGGFGGNVLGLMPPGSVAPSQSVEVRPGGGASVRR